MYLCLACLFVAGFPAGSFISTFRTVFWWIYGRGAWENALDVPDAYADEGGVTSEVGMILAAIYHIIIIIVFVNLLIAMMARSFEQIAVSVTNIVCAVAWEIACTV